MIVSYHESVGKHFFQYLQKFLKIYKVSVQAIYDDLLLEKFVNENDKISNIEINSSKGKNKNIIQTLPEITKELEENLDHIKSSSTKESEDISEEETKKIQDELKRLGYM